MKYLLFFLIFFVGCVDSAIDKVIGPVEFDEVATITPGDSDSVTLILLFDGKVYSYTTYSNSEFEVGEFYYLVFRGDKLTAIVKVDE